MSIDHTERPCVTHKPWDDMTLEEKVEALGDWSVEVTKFLEQLYVFKIATKHAAGDIEKALDGITAKMNGGGPPVKHPKDPGC